MALPSTLNDLQFASWVELGASGIPARRAVLYDASGNALLGAAAAAADGTANPTAGKLLTFPHLLNAAGLWERQRGNLEGTLLASGTRNADAVSADQTNYNGRGLLLFLNVTAASGTGGLTPRLQAKDPVSANYLSYDNFATAVTATGTFVYMYYPGAAQGATRKTDQLVLARTWRAYVSHGDGSSYTYSLGFSVIV